MFTVAWTPAALDDLTTAWTSAEPAVRQQINAAMTLLERHLRANADRLGESREDDGTRVLIVEPLGIEFIVSIADRMVNGNPHAILPSAPRAIHAAGWSKCACRARHADGATEGAVLPRMARGPPTGLE